MIDQTTIDGALLLLSCAMIVFLWFRRDLDRLLVAIFLAFSVAMCIEIPAIKTSLDQWLGTSVWTDFLRWLSICVAAYLLNELLLKRVERPSWYRPLASGIALLYAGLLVTGVMRPTPITVHPNSVDELIFASSQSLFCIIVTLVSAASVGNYMVRDTVRRSLVRRTELNLIMTVLLVIVGFYISRIALGTTTTFDLGSGRRLHLLGQVLQSILLLTVPLIFMPVGVIRFVQAPVAGWQQWRQFQLLRRLNTYLAGIDILADHIGFVAFMGKPFFYIHLMLIGIMDAKRQVTSEIDATVRQRMLAIDDNEDYEQLAYEYVAIARQLR
jgi:hypothetical protein